MRQVAIYGKGGIGKSTTTQNLNAGLGEMGKNIMIVGCDPKADSTRLILGGLAQQSVLDTLREEGEDIELDLVLKNGFKGIRCVESGGPEPGVGCAGRGIIAAMEKLSEKKAFEVYKPDAVIYDVLGDVVCGGFAMPIREGYAEDVLIVTSGEKMALYAANNIATAVENFADRGYAKVRGVLLNRRNVPREEEKVRAFAEAHQLPVLADIPRSDAISEAEERGMTVVEAAPEDPVSQAFFALAREIVQEKAEG